jgi:DNA replication and repair protein RecF
MILDSLQLYQFRNYEHCCVSFSPGLNIFLGSNGQGKTNLIEALVLTFSGQFLRSHKTSDLLKVGCTEGAIFGKSSNTKGDQQEYRVILDPKQKKHFLNNKKTSAVEVFRSTPFVIFTPESLASIKNAPELRRDLIDNLASQFQPTFYQTYLSFKKALWTRNKILKTYKEGLSSLEETTLLLKSLDSQYFSLASQVTYLRYQAIKGLESFFQNAAQSLFHPKVMVEIQYFISHKKLENDSLDTIYLTMKNRWDELKIAELKSGVTLVGPHKHDVHFIFEGQNSRHYCSQGQQRALILAFKIAQVVYHRQVFGSYPFLVLDDVLSELDDERCQELVKFLKKISAQVFMTTTQLHGINQNQFEQLRLFHAQTGTLVDLGKKDSGCVERC